MYGLYGARAVSVSWWCTWQGHGVHVCWGIGCVLRARGWLAMSTRHVFLLLYVSVRAGALDGLVGQGRDAIVGGWFCIANRGDDNLVKNISVVMARVFVGCAVLVESTTTKKPRES